MIKFSVFVVETTARWIQSHSQRGKGGGGGWEQSLHEWALFVITAFVTPMKSQIRFLSFKTTFYS